MLEKLHCQICEGTSSALDVVDFNKSCEEARGKYLQLSGIPIYYYICEQCGFCFSPEMSKWQLSEFEKKIYNDEYIKVDPDYKGVRPKANAESMLKLFKGKEASLNHLDYGGGDGLLSETLRAEGWQSSSYDPFVDRVMDLSKLGSFNLITAYEVFEHVPDVRKLMSQITSLLTGDGVVIFSTLTSDGNIGPNQRINWWYASPRNGHISIFSKKSLGILASKYNFIFGSFSSGVHVFFKTVPEWAAHFIKI